VEDLFMLIALDYDGTYTEDPVLWDDFIVKAKSSGHDVKILTMRYPHEPIDIDGIEVIYTSRKAKYGYIPANIYIDNEPGRLFSDSI
jgi:hypothetical protein